MKSGEYSVKITLTDINDNPKSQKYSISVIIKSPEEKLSTENTQK